MARKRRKAKPKRQRRPAVPTRVVEYPEQPPIRLKEITVWRKGGRFTRPGTPGATRSRYVAQVGPSGRILDVVEKTERAHVIRTVLPGAVEANEGLLTRALGETNAFTSSLGAKHVQVTVSFTNPEGRRESFKLDHRTVDKAGRPLPRTDINNLMVGSIVQALRQRGYRTRYTLNQVDWTRVTDRFRRTATGGRINITGRTQVARRQEVTGVRIQVEVSK